MPVVRWSFLTEVFLVEKLLFMLLGWGIWFTFFVTQVSLLKSFCNSLVSAIYSQLWFLPTDLLIIDSAYWLFGQKGCSLCGVAVRIVKLWQGLSFWCLNLLFLLDKVKFGRDFTIHIIFALVFILRSSTALKACLWLCWLFSEVHQVSCAFFNTVFAPLLEWES